MEGHDAPTHEAIFRFYAELNDFLPAARRQREFVYVFRGRPDARDAIEAMGVPHPEVDLIVVNGESVGFDYHLREGDSVSVYPVFEALDISPIVRLRPRPLRVTRFMVDVHLGKLARALRLLGFDSAYEHDATGAGIVERAGVERRIILTRNRQLLKSSAVTHGYWIRSTDPRAQVREVLDRLDLRGRLNPFTRCTECNGAIEPAVLASALSEAPERVREWCTEYHRCADCRKLYWKGTHYQRLREFVDWAAAG